MGTAQLGMPYGIANQLGKPGQSEAFNILQEAWRNGIRVLDTAQAYGQSETVIGNFLEIHPECPFEVVSKLHPDTNIKSVDVIGEAVRLSRKKLGQPPLGMLVHKSEHYLEWDNFLGKALIGLKEQGECGYLGVSVYKVDEFCWAMNHPDIDWIQAPFNIFDQRLLEGKLFERARLNGKRVFLRSIFLQGLILVEPEMLPSTMVHAYEPIKKFRVLCERFNLSPKKAALSFASNLAPDATLIVGCESRFQIKEVAHEISRAHDNPNFLREARALKSNDSSLIDPSTWC